MGSYVWPGLVLACTCRWLVDEVEVGWGTAAGTGQLIESVPFSWKVSFQNPAHISAMNIFLFFPPLDHYIHISFRTTSKLHLNVDSRGGRASMRVVGLPGSACPFLLSPQSAFGSPLRSPPLSLLVARNKSVTRPITMSSPLPPPLSREEAEPQHLAVIHTPSAFVVFCGKHRATPTIGPHTMLPG